MLDEDTTDTVSEDNFSNPYKTAEVNLDSELKEWLVLYTANKMVPEDGLVTTEMIVEVFASDFPEFLLVLAEENYFRGYEQALVDIGDIRPNVPSNER